MCVRCQETFLGLTCRRSKNAGYTFNVVKADIDEYAIGKFNAVCGLHPFYPEVVCKM
jgi:hypothetical protein